MRGGVCCPLWCYEANDGKSSAWRKGCFRIEAITPFVGGGFYLHFIPNESSTIIYWQGCCKIGMRRRRKVKRIDVKESGRFPGDGLRLDGMMVLSKFVR